MTSAVAVEAVRQISLGRAPIPIPAKSKGPHQKGWQDWRFTPAEAQEAFEHNLGLILGPASSNLVDVDLDCPEAVTLADIFLPPTAMVHGRPGKPRSHRWYVVDDPPTLARYRDVSLVVTNGKRSRPTMVELRSSRGIKAAQTVIPPSIHHPTGELLTWEDPDGQPAHVSAAALTRDVRRLAAVCLAARHFPAEGGRHDYALALAGCLLRHGWTTEDARAFIYCAAETGGSTDPEARAAVVDHTAAELAAGQPVTGVPRLKEIAGQEFANEFASLLDLEERAQELAAHITASADGDRPAIRIVTDEPDVINQVIDALTHRPQLFCRAGSLVEVIDDPDGVRVRPVPMPRLREFIAGSCLLERWDERKKAYVPAHPPEWLVSAVHSRPEWPGMRRLKGVAEGAAIVGDVGRVVAEAGYDPASGLFLGAPLAVDVAIAPTHDDARQAAARILELVNQFDFTEGASSAWLCALLTVISRHAFLGPAPLILLDAPVAGSGKTLLVEMISRIACGQSAPRTAYTDRDEEMSKIITSMAMAGKRMVLLDNIENGSVLKSASLDAALTSDLWSARVLGGNTLFEGKLDIVWFASGNNLAVAGDLARRILTVRVEPKIDSPELRADFRIARIDEYVTRHRTEIMSAALTILRATMLHRPQLNLPAWNSFTGWSDLPRTAVAWATGVDPGIVRGAFSVMADRDRGMQAQLVGELEKAFCVSLFSASDVLDHCYRAFAFGDKSTAISETMREAVEHLTNIRPGQKPTPVQVGHVLRKLRGRRFNGVQLIGVQDKHSKSLRWGITAERLEQVN